MFAIGRQLNTFFLLFFAFTIQFSFAQENNSKYLISNAIGNFEFKEMKPNQMSKLSGESFDGKYFRLIQFYEIPTEEQRKLWTSQGFLVADYLAANTYYTIISKSFSLRQLRGIARAIVPVGPEFKKEASLFFQGVPSHAKKGTNQAQFIISYYKSIDVNSVQNDLKFRGVKVLAHRDYSQQLDVLFDVSDVDFITNLPYIQFIGAQLETPIDETLDYRNSTGRANFLNTGYNGLNYNGQGVVLGVGEGGTVSGAIDFKGRVTEVGSSGVAESHKIGSTQNAGGSGNLDPTNRNNAWGATLLSISGSPDYSALYSSHNLRYTNHSYGWSVSGGYDSTARSHDLRIAALPNHLVSYSSGNSGADLGFAPYAFAGWSNITGQPKQNKNMIAVGALSPDDQITGFSSRGPMYDGRIIPQLVIEGSEGTSYASPKAIGDIAILAQVYKDKNAGIEPPSSLLRAVIMDTADDLGNPGPDYIHGFGRPNLRRAYQVIHSNQIISGSVANGVTNNHNIVIPTNVKQVRVMIVWPDVAAAVNANPAIVNNLNLVLRDPSLTTYNPWVLNSAASIASISAPATRGVDNLNTIEQVTVDNPVSGLWAIAVNGFNVPSGPQAYYLVYEFLVDELQITYPLQNEKFITGEDYYIRWDSYGETGTFNLAYELNNNGVWLPIVNGHPASSRVYKWLVPNVSGGINSIKIRVQRGSSISISGANQIGRRPDNFRVTKACNDEITLSWSPIAGATAYKVYRLGAQYMEEVTTNITFSGNSAKLTGQSTTNSELYAVSALTSSIEGQRTITLEKVPGDINCSGNDWIGTISTDWFTVGNWSMGSLPTANDNVNILSTAPFQPSIAAVGAVCGNITIHTGATLTMSASTAYTLSVSNDWVNNGTFVRGIGIVDFVGTNSYQEIRGSSTTNFNILKVTKGARDRIVEANSLIILSAAANPLNLVSGTFKLSSNSTITPLTSVGLDSTMGLWNNGGTINFGNYSWFLNGGLFRISAGTTNIGTASNNTVTYLNNPSFTVEGGLLNIGGRISPNSSTSSITMVISEGTVTVNRFGSTSATRAPFEMTINANFSFTGGTLVIPRASSNTSEFLNLAASSMITGGTLQIGNASSPVNQTIRINSVVPIHNLTINAANSPRAQLVTNNLTINGDLTISGGTLDANGRDLLCRGNWTNNGSFTAGLGTVTFGGAINQKISGTSITTFKGFTLNNELGITLNGSVNVTVDGQLTLTNGVITTGLNKLILTSNGTVSRTLGHVFGNFQKAFSSTNLVNNFEVGDALIDHFAPVQVSFATITTPGNLTVNTQSIDHPSLASSNLIQGKSINRYWTLQNSGIAFSTYSAVFNYLPSDQDAELNIANIRTGNYNSTWSYLPVASANSSSVTVTNLLSFGDYQFAELNSIVNLKFYIEAYFDSTTGMMRSVRNNQDGLSPFNEVEMVTVELRNSSNYLVIATTNAMIERTGLLSAAFQSVPDGSYHIAIKGRNMIQTWSAAPHNIGLLPLTYDFTTSASKAFGNNMKEVAAGVWAFYSGDINQDEGVDNSDADALLSDIENYSSGVFATDLNGDGGVDNLDTDAFFSNLENYIYSNHP
jgi:hypothetical protein